MGTTMSSAARAALVLGLFILPAAVPAQDAGPEFEVKAAAVTVAPGGKAEARVTVVIPKGYRILAAPPPNKWTTPLSVAFEGSSSLYPETVVLPPGKPYMEEGKLSYHGYEGTIVFTLPVRADKDAGPGDYVLHGRLRSQVLILDPDGLASYKRAAVKGVDLPVHVSGTKKK
jgi:DsbC/DsbD-like thiol-disulfide interchange protein